MRQIHYSFFILSQTFLTLFLPKNIFMWYEWLGMHAAFQPWNSETNFFLPSAPICFAFQYSYSFLKLTSLSLTGSTKTWFGHAYMSCISQAAFAGLCFSPWWQLPEGGSASAAVWGQGRRRRQQAVDTGIWLHLPQGPQSYCSAGWFFCTRLLFQDMKAPLPEANQCEPAPLLSLHLLGDEYIMAKLHCVPFPQSNGEHSSLHYFSD